MSNWPEATQERARVILARYPTKRSALMPLLYLAMAEDGYLTDAGMAEVAEWVGNHSGPSAGRRLLLHHVQAGADRAIPDLVLHIDLVHAAWQ